MTDRVYRFVPWPLVADYVRIGWVVAADLGPTHGCWSCCMERICECGRMAMGVKIRNDLPNECDRSITEGRAAARRPAPKGAAQVMQT